jgi:hypothetical protein
MGAIGKNSLVNLAVGGSTYPDAATIRNTTPSMTKLCIMTRTLTTPSKKKPNIKTPSITTLSIMAFSITK